jgi:large subunit ribosomal protein L10
MSEAETRRKTETVPEWKREEVTELVDMIEGYDSVGVVSMAGIPSRQLQNMRRELHGQAELRVSRNTLLRRGLDEAGRSELEEHVYGQVGLIGTDDNPFGLYRELENSKTPAPINAGEIAPNDIVVPEGDTGVEDGQFIGDLNRVGVDSRFQDGAVRIVNDTVVLEEGEEVGDTLAGVLSTLEIEPKEVGLDLRAVLSDGILFDPEDLVIDLDEYRDDVASAAAGARNLAVNAAIPEPDVVGALLSKARSEAIAVGVEGAVTEPGLVEHLLGSADAQVRALAGAIDDEEALPEELRDVDPAPTTETDEPEVDESDEDDEEEPEPESAADETDEDDDDEDDDDDDAGAGLGAMFG